MRLGGVPPLDSRRHGLPDQIVPGGIELQDSHFRHSVDESPSQAIVPRGAQSEAAVAHLLVALDRLPGTETRLLRAGAAAAAAPP